MQGQVGWVVLAQGLSQNCNQALSRRCNYFKIHPEMQNLLTSRVAGRSNHISCPDTGQRLLFLSMQISSQKPFFTRIRTERQRERQGESMPRMKMTTFSNQTVNAMCHHFCCLSHKCFNPCVERSVQGRMNTRNERPLRVFQEAGPTWRDSC